MDKTAVFLAILLILQPNAPSKAWLQSEEKGWVQKRDDRIFNDMEERYRLERRRLNEKRSLEDEALNEKYKLDGTEAPDEMKAIRDRYEEERDALEQERKAEDDAFNAAHDEELRLNFPERWRAIEDMRIRDKERLEGKNEDTENAGTYTGIGPEEEKLSGSEAGEPGSGPDETSEKDVSGEKSGGVIEWIDEEGNPHKNTL